ncbi:hypothetical protein HYQ46_002413 [Verticillium longisporum]|nr:hypothetical protein HYQ46_002413 [Verticillium longisporum]
MGTQKPPSNLHESIRTHQSLPCLTCHDRPRRLNPRPGTQRPPQPTSPGALMKLLHALSPARPGRST